MSSGRTSVCGGNRVTTQCRRAVHDERRRPRGVGQFRAGSGVTTFDLRTADGRVWKIGPLICYDDILEDVGRTLGALHPNLLVNITNDSWFGDTSEPWQHLALSVFRTVETRTDLVRSVNTSVSAFVDATGRVYAKTYAVDPAKHAVGADRLHASAALLDGGHTVFVTIGNLFAYLQGPAVSLSSDGSTAAVGGYGDNSSAGAVWIWTRNNGIWTQRGTKLVGSGAVGAAQLGFSVSLSGDGKTAITGGWLDNNLFGAVWVYARVHRACVLST